uniref:Uncharacterized protein n=1 Tax=Ixodes ricinus TaxID=34613 RepID=A0A147BQU4_IXORI
MGLVWSSLGIPTSLAGVQRASWKASSSHSSSLWVNSETSCCCWDWAAGAGWPWEPPWAPAPEPAKASRSSSRARPGSTYLRRVAPRRANSGRSSCMSPRLRRSWAG